MGEGGKETRQRRKGEGATKNKIESFFFTLFDLQPKIFFANPESADVRHCRSACGQKKKCQQSHGGGGGKIGASGAVVDCCASFFISVSRPIGTRFIITAGENSSETRIVRLLADSGRITALQSVACRRSPSGGGLSASCLPHHASAPQMGGGGGPRGVPPPPTRPMPLLVTMCKARKMASRSL